MRITIRMVVCVDMHMYVCIYTYILAGKRKYIKTLSIKGSIKLIFFRKGIKYVYNRLAFN